VIADGRNYEPAYGYIPQGGRMMAKRESGPTAKPRLKKAAAVKTPPRKSGEEKTP
jgi:hypothetical protein